MIYRGPEASQGQQVEEGKRTAAARQLPGWLDWRYQPPSTAHPSPCQPLWRAAPGLIGWAGEEDSYRVLGSYTFLVSEGGTGCLP